MFGFFGKAKGRMQIGPMLEQSKYLLLHHGIHMTTTDWDDPYLYGYYSGATFVLLKAGSSGRMDNADISTVQAWGWMQLTDLPELLYLTRTSSVSGGKSSEWKDGSDKGILWSMLLTGNANRSSQKVQEAIELGRDFEQMAELAGVTGEKNELQSAAACVYQRDWFEYIRLKKKCS